MTTAQDALKYFDSLIGTTESPPGSNTNAITRAYGLNGQPWCCMNVYIVLTHVKVPCLKTAYTVALADWFKDQKRGFANDRKAIAGDIVFFNFPDSLDRIQHVGMVRANNDRLATIEGNTSSGVSGSQDDGGGVFPRQRGYLEAVYYGRPLYDHHEELPEFEFPKVKTWFGKGDSGADVKGWQIDLNRWEHDLQHKDFDFHLELTRHFDEPTLNATKTFQHRNDLDVDGRVGKHTIEVMERIRDRQEGRDDG